MPHDTRHRMDADRGPGRMTRDADAGGPAVRTGDIISMPVGLHMGLWRRLGAGEKITWGDVLAMPGVTVTPADAQRGGQDDGEGQGEGQAGGRRGGGG